MNRPYIGENFELVKLENENGNFVLKYKRSKC